MNWERIIQLALALAIATVIFQSVQVGRLTATIQEQTAMIEKLRAECVK